MPASDKLQHTGERAVAAHLAGQAAASLQPLAQDPDPHCTESSPRSRASGQLQGAHPGLGFRSRV